MSDPKTSTEKEDTGPRALERQLALFSQQLRQRVETPTQASMEKEETDPSVLDTLMQTMDDCEKALQQRVKLLTSLHANTDRLQQHLTTLDQLRQRNPSNSDELVSPEQFYDQMGYQTTYLSFSNYLQRYCLAQLQAKGRLATIPTDDQKKMETQTEEAKQNVIFLKSLLSYAKGSQHLRRDEAYRQTLATPFPPLSPLKLVYASGSGTGYSFGLINTRLNSSVRLEWMIQNPLKRGLIIRMYVWFRSAHSRMPLRHRKRLLFLKGNDLSRTQFYFSVCETIWATLGLQHELKTGLWDFLLGLLPKSVNLVLRHHPMYSRWQSQCPAELYFHFMQWATTKDAETCLPSKDVRQLIGSYLDHFNQEADTADDNSVPRNPDRDDDDDEYSQSSSEPGDSDAEKGPEPMSPNYYLQPGKKKFTMESDEDECSICSGCSNSEEDDT